MTDTRTLGYKFRLRPRKSQARRMGQLCAAARYAWNFSLAEYESALDEARAQPPQADKGATSTVRDILESRLTERGLAVSRRGDKSKTLSLQSIMYKLWCHHRDTEAPEWVQAATKSKLGGHSHVGNYPVRRLCGAIARWWKAAGKRAPWNTATERKAGKKTKAKRSRAATGRLVGPPRYKRRGQNPSFTIQVNRKSIDRYAIRVPAIGRVYVADRRDQNPEDIIPPDAAPKVLTVREVAGYWEAAVCVQEPWTAPAPDSSLPACGIDLGMNAEATIVWSDGKIERVEPPMPLRHLGVRLVHLQQRLSLSKYMNRCVECGFEEPVRERKKRRRKCECGGRMRSWRSNRGMRLKLKISKIHDHIRRVRADHLHNLSDRLIRKSYAICTEPHNVTGLVSGGVERRLAESKYKGILSRAIRKAMLDIGWGMLRQQLSYKAKWYGCDYVTLPEGTATDKLCWRCGHHNNVPNDTNEYTCGKCKWEGTRQENTARLCLGYIHEFPEESGRPDGDPAAGRKNDATGQKRASSSALPARRESGVNEGMESNDITPGAQAPGGSRKAESARKAGTQRPEEARA